ncbi:MAG: hypothetical protein ABEH78_01270 [Haloferacaceae archaeon]
MKVVLNEFTETIHKHEPGTSELHTVCGISHHLDHDQLHRLPAERATTNYDASKCGRCFDDGGGY